MIRDDAVTVGSGAEAVGRVAVSALACGLACVPAVFNCTDDAECEFGGVRGWCEATGYCSFADDSCPSGVRYGEHAASEYAGVCVDAGFSAGGDEDTSSGDETGQADEVPSRLPRPWCGDGVLGPDEDCDDGNQIDGDGCNADCFESGALLWALNDDLSDGEDDRAHAVAMLDGGDVVVTGVVGAGNYGGEILAARYHAEGVRTWSTKLPAGIGWGVAIDSDRRIVVVGEHDLVATTDTALHFLDAEGNYLQGASAPEVITGAAYAVASDPGRGCLVAGTRGVTFRAAWVRRYVAGESAFAWEETWGEEPFGDVAARSVAVAPDGTTYVVGSVGEHHNAIAFVLAYEVDGTSRFIVDGGLPVRTANAVHVAPDGAILVAGSGFGSDDSAPIVFALNSEGQVLWSRTVGGGTEGTAYAVVTDVLGSVLVAGSISNAEDDEDGFVEKLTPSHEDLWFETFAGDAGKDDQARGIAVDARGNVFVAGYIDTVDEGENVWLGKYRP